MNIKFVNFINKIFYVVTILFLFFLLESTISFAQQSPQENIRIMSYNINEYDNSTDSPLGTAGYRDTCFQKIMNDINPDVLVTYEVHSDSKAQYFLDDVMNINTNSTSYERGTFILNSNVSTSNNTIYYKPSKFTFLGSQMVINSGDNPTLEFQLYNNLTGDKITIFGAHFTFNSSSQKTLDANAIRSITYNFSTDDYYIAAGDFNSSDGGSDVGWNILIDTSTPGYFIDPLYSLVLHSGSWHTPSMAPYLTYVCRNTAFGGGGNGNGFIYRTDMILNSNSVTNSGGSVTFVSGSYVTYGNDGLHYQSESINDNGTTGLPNQAVSQDLADALYWASDHLPIYADYTFSSPTTANPPYQGSIAFTQVDVGDGTGSHPNEIEFVTLYRMDLTTLKITNNVVNADGSLGTGGGTYDLSNTSWTDVPAGTHVRLGASNDNDASDGILAYDGTGSVTPVFSSSGNNQVIAYTGSSSSPTYIAGLHWGGTSGVWPNPSYEPNTSSDLALGNNNNYYFSGTLTGTLYTDRDSLVNLNNWNGSSTWESYHFQPLPVELSSFTSKVSKAGIDLYWRTETEVNNYGFEIQRSTDKVSWNKIGFVPGNGNSNSPKDYTYIDKSASGGRIYYKLKQIDIDGKYEYSNVIEVDYNISTEASLSQNYPNPFNPATTIEYTIPEGGFVSLKVYDILGREVITLVNGKQEAGRHSVIFNGTGLTSGIYFYILKTENKLLTKKMSLLK